jgi:hypothetical protein
MTKTEKNKSRFLPSTKTHLSFVADKNDPYPGSHIEFGFRYLNDMECAHAVSGFCIQSKFRNFKFNCQPVITDEL